MLKSYSHILKISIDMSVILGKEECYMMATEKMGHKSHFVRGGSVQTSFSSSYQVTKPHSPGGASLVRIKAFIKEGTLVGESLPGHTHRRQCRETRWTFAVVPVLAVLSFYFHF